MLHDRLQEAGELELALAAAEEAIVLLASHLRQLPHAYAGLMGVMLRDDEQIGADCGLQPDEERLRPIREVLATLEDLE